MELAVKPELEEFVEKYQRQVHIASAYEVNRYGRLLSDTDIEEFTQEVWHKVVKHYPAFNPQLSSPTTWIINLARTIGVTKVRKSVGMMKKGMPIPIDDVQEIKLPRSNGVHDPLVRMEKRETKETVQKCMAQIQKKYRVILHRYYWEDLKTSVIAKELSQEVQRKISPDLVRYLKAKAMLAAKRKIVGEMRRLAVGKKRILDRSIGALDIPPYMARSLRAANVNTIGQLVKLAPGDVMALPLISRRGFQKIRKAVFNLGLRMRQE